MSTENQKWFGEIVNEVLIKQHAEIDLSEEKTQSSRKHRIRMNRFAREYCRVSSVPFPEVDGCFERVRSKIIIKLRRDRPIERYLPKSAKKTGKRKRK